MSTRSRESSSNPDEGREGKRVRLDVESDGKQQQNGDGPIYPSDAESFEDHCSICLHQVADRTIIPNCSHEFCFDCLLIWCDQSRRCPLCSQTIGDHLIHHIRSKYDYQKHFLLPLRTNSPKPLQAQTSAIFNRRTRAPPRGRAWGRRDQQEREEADALDRAIEKRKWIYAHDLYAKHVATNAYTRYRSYPTPAQFSASQDLISRTTMFLRRELRVWVNLDVEFLTTFIISIMKAIDIRSESAVKLLAEFLDMDTPYVPGGRFRNAEHFAHEVYSYVRSPYKDLFIYDSVVQYDSPEDIPLPQDPQQSTFWHDSSENDIAISRSRSPRSSRRISSTSRSRSPRLRGKRQRGRRSPSSPSQRDISWSPSGRRYPDDLPDRGDSDKDRDNWGRETSLPPRGEHNVGDAISHSPLQRAKGKGKERQSQESADDVDRKYTSPRFTSSNSVHAFPENHSTEAAFPIVDATESARGSEIRSITTSQHHTNLKTSQPDKRQPRTRSLLQSVQDHLGSNSRLTAKKEKRNDESLFSVASPKVPVSSFPPRSNDLKVPSLLVRLSDPYPSRILDSPPAAVDSEMNKGDSARITSPLIAHNLNGSVPHAHTETAASQSAPEPLPSHRARIATRDKERIGGLVGQFANHTLNSGSRPRRTEAASANTGVHPSMQLERYGDDTASPISLQHHGDSKDAASEPSQKPLNSPTSTASFSAPSNHQSASEHRARLLRKLVKEKRAAHAVQHQIVSGSTPEEPGCKASSEGDISSQPLHTPHPSDDIVLSQNNSPPDVFTDLPAIEAKLRSRAQLHARLAAEKRKIG